MSNRVKVVCRIRPTLDAVTGEVDVSQDCVRVYHREQTGEEADRVRFPAGNSHWADRVYEPTCKCARVCVCVYIYIYIYIVCV